jgi:tol-pal system protein YbgF
MPRTQFILSTIAGSVVLVGGMLLGQGSAHAQLFGESEETRALRAQAAQITELKTRLDGLGARIDRVEAAVRGQLELQLRVDQLMQEIARLRGTLEEQANELANTQRRQIEIQSATDARLQRLEPVAVEINGRSVKVDPSERRRFEAASALFVAKEYRNAQIALAGFITDFPDSPFLAQAFFELGASQFLLRDFKSATDNLQTLLARFPDSPRMPEALLTLASAQIELNDRRGARRTLELLLSRFPDSAVSGAAKERLQGLPPAPAGR